MEQKTFRGTLWKAIGMDQNFRGMCEHFTIKRAWARAVVADAEKERQEAYKAIGKWGRFSKRSWNWSSVAMI